MHFRVFPLEIGAERTAGGKERGVVKRRGARDAADAVSSKEFFGHGKRGSNSNVNSGRPGSSWTTSEKSNIRQNQGFSAQSLRCPLRQREKTKEAARAMKG